MNFKTHTALPGQRWDAIAYLYYQDAYRLAELTAANPQYHGLLQFKGGEALRIPALERASVAVSLPPWRR